MRIVLNKFFLSLVFLLGTFYAVAVNPAGPPVPSPAGKKKPPPPPGLSIDDNLIILLILAVLFGIYIIYNHRLKTKTSI